MKEIEKLALMTADLKRQREEIAKKFSESVESVFKEFLANNPEIEAVRWEQYTPYFNDGEPCIFNVHHPEFKFVDGIMTQEEIEECSWNEDGWIQSFWSIKDKKRKEELEAKLEGLNELAKFIEDSEEFMESVYGDHVRVIVTREGVTVEDYHHD